MMGVPESESNTNHHQHNNNNNYPLQGILEPHPHDVLCGRGKKKEKE